MCLTSVPGILGMVSLSDPLAKPGPGPRALAILVLAILPLLLVGGSVFGDRTLVPYDLAAFPPYSQSLQTDRAQALRAAGNYDTTEPPVWFLPEVRLAKDSLLHGEVPTWNPAARTGAPLHAHGLLGLCYPPNWLFLAFDDPADATGLLAWISLVIAGLGTLGLSLRLGCTPGAALGSAMVFQLSSTLVANAYFWMRLGSLVWLPAALWACLALIDAEDRRARRLATAGLAWCIAAGWLSGFPPYAAASTLITGAFAATLLCQTLRRTGTERALQHGLWFASAAVLGIGMALPQVLPSLLFFPDSARDATPTMATIAASSFDPAGLLGYLTPDLFGHPSASSQLPYQRSPLMWWLGSLRAPDGTALEPNYNYIEYSVYVGLPALLLAALGAVASSGRLAWFFRVALLVLIAMSTLAPGARLLFHLPVVDNVWPMRWMAPACLMLAVLCGRGFDVLQSQPMQAVRWLTPMACACIALALFGPGLLADPQAMAVAIGERFGGHPPENVIAYIDEGQTPSRFQLAGERASAAANELLLWALVSLAMAVAAWFVPHRKTPSGLMTILGLLLLAVPLLLHGRPLVAGQLLEPDSWTEVHQFLADQHADRGQQGGITVARASKLPTLPSQLPPGPLLGHRIRDLHFDTHYDARSHQPLAELYKEEHLADKGYLTKSLPDDVRLQHRLLDLYGVTHLLTTEPLDHAGQEVGPTYEGPGGRFLVYARPTGMPRAWFVDRAEAVDDQEALERLLDEGFDAQTVVLLAASQPGVAAVRSERSDPEAVRERSSSIRFVHDRPAAVAIEIGPGPAGHLVLADTWLAGWTATIDGAKTPVYRANLFQRAVSLPETACEVRFEYRAPGLQAGGITGAFALLVTLGLLALGRRR